jgi:hypothetical protein
MREGKNNNGDIERLERKKERKKVTFGFAFGEKIGSKYIICSLSNPKSLIYFVINNTLPISYQSYYSFCVLHIMLNLYLDYISFFFFLNMIC